jgi:hypothetical protein
VKSSAGALAGGGELSAPPLPSNILSSSGFGRISSKHPLILFKPSGLFANAPIAQKQKHINKQIAKGRTILKIAHPLKNPPLLGSTYFTWFAM